MKPEPNYQVRLYQAGDRPKVRQICADTADRGEPIENIFFDRVWITDLLTDYYLKYEPANTWVAVVNGQVVGYLTGCMNNRNYGLVFIFILIPQLFFKGLVRGTFFHGSFVQLLKIYIQNWQRWTEWRKNSFHSSQGHLHIGVEIGFQRQHLGQVLLEPFLLHAKSLGLKEVCASVHEENAAGCRFFESFGFEAKHKYPLMMCRDHLQKKIHAVEYVKNLS